MRTLIKNGLLCLENEILRQDLLIDSGKIVSTRPDATSDGALVVDASGQYVAPGFIDFHVHLDDRIGAYDLADNWFCGSKIAVQNGITGMINFITQKPKQSLSQAVLSAMKKAEGKSFCDYHWHLTPTRFDDALWPELDELISKGFRTVKLYTTYRNAGIFSDYEQIENIFSKMKNAPVTFLIHCEDDGLLSAAKVAPEQLASSYAHALLRPAEAEIRAIEKLTELSQKYLVPLHVVHVSTLEGVKLIYENKQHLKVTCETCPQYLFLSEDDLKKPDGYKLICSPPLRKAENAGALREAAISGLFDLYATDHCAFLKKDKRGSDPHDVRTVPNGIPGIGALIPLIFNLYTSKFSVTEWVRRLTSNPARIAGIYPKKGALLPGSDADVAIFSLNGPERKIRSSLADVYDPYGSLTTTLDIRDVFLRGRPVISGGRFINDQIPEGQWICGT